MHPLDEVRHTCRTCHRFSPTHLWVAAEPYILVAEASADQQDQAVQDPRRACLVILCCHSCGVVLEADPQTVGRAAVELACLLCELEVVQGHRLVAQSLHAAGLLAQSLSLV